MGWSLITLWGHSRPHRVPCNILESWNEHTQLLCVWVCFMAQIKRGTHMQGNNGCLVLMQACYVLILHNVTESWQYYYNNVYTFIFLFQPTAEIHKYFLFVCKSEGQVALYAVLFGYKGLLQVIALILAFRTRKVKVKGLDDSKYIAAAIYVTSIVLAVIIVSTYTLRDYVNVYPAVVGMGFLLGTTTILALVFVPRVSSVYIVRVSYTESGGPRDLSPLPSNSHPPIIIMWKTRCNGIMV